jgi:prephenate dehydrogenase
MSITDWPQRIAILGIGLLGGSTALAIRRAQPSVVIHGWSRRKATCDEAVSARVIDTKFDSAEEACRDCDVVVVAAPVDMIPSLVISALESSPDECLVTDVGSTKARIVETVCEHQLAARKFVPAHPIAGREKSGVAYALADLFDQRTVVLTPHTNTDANAIDRAKMFWELTGARVSEMDAERHDMLLAATSHVPHLVSSAVASRLPDDGIPLVGSGWMDITRVAAGDPGMWVAICNENREAICAELRQFAKTVQELMEFLNRADDSQLLLWLAQAKAIRDHVSQ